MRISSFLVFACALATIAQNVLQLDIQGPQHAIYNYQKLYVAGQGIIYIDEAADFSISIKIGTPPQSQLMQLDIRTTDIWLAAPNPSYCYNSPETCVPWPFVPQNSTTLKPIGGGDFNISYVDDTVYPVNFITDTLSIETISGTINIDHQQMGLIDRTTFNPNTGSLGIGFVDHELICNKGPLNQCPSHLSLLQNLVLHKAINTQAYSMWLDDRASSGGSILFGGIDAKKFNGMLTTLPIQPNESGLVNSFTIAWTGLTLGTPEGVKNIFVSENFKAPAILDLSTLPIIIPDDIAFRVFEQFGAAFFPDAGCYVAPCSLRSSIATLNFQFGGPEGATIQVPVAELLFDEFDGYDPEPTFPDGANVCRLLIEPANGRPTIFGYYFIRFTYLVIDLENLQISLAQTHFYSNESNVLEIQTGKTGVPSATIVATTISIGQSTDIQRSFIGDPTYISSLSPTITASFQNGNPPLGQYTNLVATSSQFGASTSATAATQTAAASQVNQIAYPLWIVIIAKYLLL